MTTALPPEIILPGGQPAYLNPYRGTYTTSRSYALRMQSGYARGMSRQSARGHVSPTGVTEYALRAQRFQQKYGYSLSWWRKVQRKYIQPIEDMGQVPGNDWPTAGNWRDIIAEDYRIVTLWYGTGPVPGIIIPPENIVEERLMIKIESMVEYREGDRSTGRGEFYARSFIRPIEMYWYH
jgi:hypothetical protein